MAQPYSCPTRDSDQGADSSGNLAWRDRLRLDVMVLGVNETFSYTGASAFQSHDKTELVGFSPVGTGDFEGFLNGIFGHEGATFQYLGERKGDGELLAEYSFHVPLERSGYVVRSGTRPHVIGYSGNFLLNKATASLERLTVFSYALPEDTKLCRLKSQIEYQIVSVGQGRFLLPAGSELRVLYTNGDESATRTEYSNCKKFSAESKLRFDESPSSSDAPEQSGANPTLQNAMTSPVPPGLDLEIRFAGPVDSDQIDAGDPIDGALPRALKDRQGRTWFPKNAVVHGRLVRMREYSVPERCFVLGVRFESVELNGASIPLSIAANTDNVQDAEREKSVMQTGMSARPKALALNQFEDGRPDVATVLFPGTHHLLLKPGFATHWKTVARTGHDK